MADKELFAKTVILTTGAAVPFAATVLTLFMLDGLGRGDPPADRELLFHLRQACLARGPAPDEWRDDLARLGAVRADGSVDPVTREVVLASVQGYGRALTIVSPYTREWDKVISDLIVCREKVRAVLPRDEAELVIGGRDLGVANTTEELAKWADRVRKRGSRNLYPDSPN